MTRLSFIKKLGFVRAGLWKEADTKNRVGFELALAFDKRAVYAFAVDGEVVYVGVCERDTTNLRDRMRRYQSRQGGSTNRRISEKILAALIKGSEVTIWALSPLERPNYRGLPVDLVKGLENPLISALQQLGAARLWNSLGRKPSRQESPSITQFIRAIRRLPSDESTVQPGVWYKTQKEHWLGWLKEYDGPGYYNRIPEQNRTAEYAYNHAVNPLLLLWLIEASGVDAHLVAAAERAAKKGRTMMEKSGAIRRLVPWPVVADRLWGSKAAPS